MWGACAPLTENIRRRAWRTMPDVFSWGRGWFPGCDAFWDVTTIFASCFNGAGDGSPDVTWGLTVSRSAKGGFNGAGDGSPDVTVLHPRRADARRLLQWGRRWFPGCDGHLLLARSGAACKGTDRAPAVTPWPEGCPACCRGEKACRFETFTFLMTNV